MALGTPARAQGNVPESTSNEPAVEQGEEAPTELETMVIMGGPQRLGSTRLDAPRLTDELEVNLGEILVDLAGVWAVRRGANATDLVVRGFGGERVRTQVGVVPVLGGSPASMDPPLTYLTPHAVNTVTIETGLPSVAGGPGAIGGRVTVSPDFVRPRGAADEIHGFVSGGYDSARSGYRSECGLFGGTERVDARATAGMLRFHDYESPDGREVPADLIERNASLSMGFKPLDGHRFWNAFSYVRQEDAEFPGMPMNKRGSDTYLFNTGYRIDTPGKRVEQIDLQGGMSRVEHQMTNLWKPTRQQMEAEANSTAAVYAGALRLGLRPGDRLRVATGVGFEKVDKDAARDRYIIAQDQTATDHVWPDAHQSDVGAFAELTFELEHDLRLSAGGRADLVTSDAAAVEEPGFANKPIRTHYDETYGAGSADEIDRDEKMGSGNLLLEWSGVDDLALQLGAGYLMRAASVSERYYAFAPRPGGYLLGNPTLVAEKGAQLEARAIAELSWLDASLSGFFIDVRDYIMETTVDQRDINGDQVDDNIRGYRNVDAELYGFETTLDLRLAEHLRIPATLAYVHGDNTSEGGALPQIPPLSGDAALRLELGESLPWWAQIGTRFAAEQPAERVDPSFPENASEGWATLNLRAGARLFDALHVEAGVENLLDAEYHEHLTRAAALKVGGLEAGDEVPAPGRSLFVMIRGEY